MVRNGFRPFTVSHESIFGEGRWRLHVETSRMNLYPDVCSEGRGVRERERKTTRGTRFWPYTSDSRRVELHQVGMVMAVYNFLTCSFITSTLVARKGRPLSNWSLRHRFSGQGKGLCFLGYPFIGSYFEGKPKGKPPWPPQKPRHPFL